MSAVGEYTASLARSRFGVGRKSVRVWIQILKIQTAKNGAAGCAGNGELNVTEAGVYGPDRKGHVDPLRRPDLHRVGGEQLAESSDRRNFEPCLGIAGAGLFFHELEAREIASRRQLQ